MDNGNCDFEFQTYLNDMKITTYAIKIPENLSYQIRLNEQIFK